jgi:hypothetical protein
MISWATVLLQLPTRRGTGHQGQVGRVSRPTRARPGRGRRPVGGLAGPGLRPGRRRPWRTLRVARRTAMLWGGTGPCARWSAADGGRDGRHGIRPDARGVSAAAPGSAGGTPQEAMRPCRLERRFYHMAALQGVWLAVPPLHRLPWLSRGRDKCVVRAVPHSKRATRLFRQREGGMNAPLTSCALAELRRG